MAGHLNGVQKLICDELPKSIFIHCSNHSLDLVLQELARQCDMFGDTLVLIKDVSKAILESGKRKAMYANIVIEPCFSDDETSVGGPAAIRPLLSLCPTRCPTRWCIRAPAIRRFDENYGRVRATLRLLVEDTSLRLTDERRATLRGHLRKLDQFSTVLSIKLALLICEPAEQLARALQSTGYTATGAKQAAQALWDTYNAMGEEEFDQAWRETEARNATCNMDLEMPTAPRRRAPPRRLGEVGNAAPVESLSPRTVLRQKFIAVLDRVKNELDRRFNQPGMAHLIKLENVLLQKKPLDSVDDLKHELGVHADDFDCDLLFTQLKIAKLVVPGTVKTVREYAAVLRDLPQVSREMINQVELLVILLLVVPATSATCERSFSALRRIKNYLRATMTQKRLTHLMMCHVHKIRTFTVSVTDVLNEFISRTNERLRVFGPPTPNP
ncbi:uncharacterized protein LOC117652274 [Thrips palmi]|uniref:Uncharacterized protein LOC117652274 n=1 Tax=Thrips palmi TaxID=161013 RepID=A0A6P9A501_THRPL|nr:uncharacterized protein LOC117652274 [Thrips palmi]